MVRIILAAVAGFIAWSIMWLGSDQVLMAAMPEWYGAHQLAFERAMTNKEAFAPDTVILLMHLVRAVIISVLSGYLAAVIAGESRRSPIILGVLLVAFGLFIQIMAWNYIPVWYHLMFLGLLIPTTVLGGRLKATTPGSSPAATNAG